MIHHLKQPKGSKLCGQTCIAMACGISVDLAIKLMRAKGATNTKHLVVGLRSAFHIDRVSTKLVRYKLHTPWLAILKVKWNNGGSHWVLIHNSFVYDPLENKRKPLYSYKIGLRKKGHITSYLSFT